MAAFARLLSVAVIATICAAPSNAQRGGVLNGIWRGKLQVVSATRATPASFWHVGDRPEIEIAISGGSATVRVMGKSWQTLKVGDGFDVSQIDRTGLLAAHQVVNGWAEQWNVTVTTKSPDELLVFMSYVAGGNLGADRAPSQFTVSAMGELSRYEGPDAGGDQP